MIAEKEKLRWDALRRRTGREVKQQAKAGTGKQGVKLGRRGMEEKRIRQERENVPSNCNSSCP
jgi:hypothetical protein